MCWQGHTPSEISRGESLLLPNPGGFNRSSACGSINLVSVLSLLHFLLCLFFWLSNLPLPSLWRASVIGSKTYSNSGWLCMARWSKMISCWDPWINYICKDFFWIRLHSRFLGIGLRYIFLSPPPTQPTTMAKGKTLSQYWSWMKLLISDFS